MRPFTVSAWKSCLNLSSHQLLLVEHQPAQLMPLLLRQGKQWPDSTTGSHPHLTANSPAWMVFLRGFRATGAAFPGFCWTCQYYLSMKAGVFTEECGVAHQEEETWKPAWSFTAIGASVEEQNFQLMCRALLHAFHFLLFPLI